ncbi:glycosyltransferase family 87 protein [Rhodopseudomonas sp.]|uniref:glycosyltransferase family 87 protein n=1 Tax=Rhodopseudomonas sp. TaxID=1078 RepID=UPI002ED794E7
MQSRGLPTLAIPAARSFVAVAAIAYLVDLFQQTRAQLTNGLGRPFGDDFINYWSGAYLAWHGRASEIYDMAAFHAFEQSVVGPALSNYHYSYPPVNLLLTAPLAFVPYVPALTLWLLLGWAAFYGALRLAMPHGGALLLALAAPAVFINALGGQNGMWTAALFGGGLGLLDRRPLFAGALLGLLVFKPQLGVLIPFALLAGGHWRAFAAAAVVALSLVGLSVAGFGFALWADYARNLAMLRHLILEDGSGVWHRFVTVFVAARRLGASVETAYAMQLAAAALACVVVVWVWFRESEAGVRNAVLLLCSSFATPYLQDYDLVFGALVVAWLWHAPSVAAKSNRPLLIACGLVLLLPLLTAPLAIVTGLCVGPLLLLPALLVAVQGAWHAGSVAAPVPQGGLVAEADRPAAG